MKNASSEEVVAEVEGVGAVVDEVEFGDTSMEIGMSVGVVKEDESESETANMENESSDGVVVENTVAVLVIVFCA